MPVVVRGSQIAKGHNTILLCSQSLPICSQQSPECKPTCYVPLHTHVLTTTRTGRSQPNKYKRQAHRWHAQGNRQPTQTYPDEMAQGQVPWGLRDCLAMLFKCMGCTCRGCSSAQQSTVVGSQGATACRSNRSWMPPDSPPLHTSYPAGKPAGSCGHSSVTRSKPPSPTHSTT